MKQCLLILCFCISLSTACVAQAGSEELTYFNLSVLNENDEKPSGMYVSVRYQPGNLIPLKQYTGNDAAVMKLSEILGYTTSNDFSNYKKVSKKSDSTVENSFQFYNIFTSHSDTPRLYGKAIIGNYVVLFVELEENMPLATFMLEKNGNTYINYPMMSEHPAITALSDAVNKTYLYAESFALQKKKPNKNTTIYFDSSLQQNNTGFAFYLDVAKVLYNTGDKNDTGNAYPKAYKPALEHYRNMLAYLSAENIGGFYSGLAEESKVRLENSFKMSGGAKGDALRYFKNDKTAYSRIIGIVDLDDTKLLLVTSPKQTKVKTIRRVYMAPVLGETRWINENMEFYIDDLFRTEEFRQALLTMQQ